MTTSNIWEVKNLINLAELLKNNSTVILGMATQTTKKKDKIMVRKFLKEKSLLFGNIIFVYMEVQKELMGKMGIISSDESVYPLVYHIRNSIVAIKVENATEETLQKSFSVAEKYYATEINMNNNDNSNINYSDKNEEIDPELEKKKIVDKAVKLDQKYEEVKIALIKEVQRRKQLELKK